MHTPETRTARTRSYALHSQPVTLTVMKLVLSGALLLALILPAADLKAQELRIAEPPVTIEDPERSTAYYDTLNGEPAVYTLQSDEPFKLFLTILAPYIAGAATDFSAEVVDTRNPSAPLAVLDGSIIEWQNFIERSGGDEYLAGPAFSATVPEGTYEVRVSRPGNDGAYVLIVGEERGFSFIEMLNSYNVLPRIKSEFFNEPAYTAFQTPLLIWPIAVLLLMIGVGIFGYLFWRSRSA